MDTNPNNNPSLNDILKPLLEAKGLVDQKIFNKLTGTYSYETKTMRVMLNGSGDVFVTIKLHPSSPTFFEDLERWLSE